MVSLREMKDREYVPQAAFIRLMTRGIASLLKISVLNLPEVLRMRNIPEGQERFVRPPRQYELPPFKEGMKSVHSDEKYLRPTLFCDPNDPHIVALAHQLGAFQVSDRVFAERAHYLVKEKMRIEETAINEVAETLERGTGTCFHLISVFVALCRCAGIKARYKIFAMSMIASWYDSMLGADPFMKRWYDSLGYFVLEAEAEVWIDGEWVNAAVGPEAEWQAATGTCISKLGETSVGNWFEAVPGTVMIMESLPYGLSTLMKTMVGLAPGSIERVNINTLKLNEKGRMIIEEAGGVEAYDAKVRAQMVKMPKMEMENKGQLTFD
ncbi:MAG: transglutaminase family protein [Methanomassiliicoccales archaeon]|nr:transglutaminase family protein [Methanomassiliicoccales archaeon]